jgi:hypothetical protein
LTADKNNQPAEQLKSTLLNYIQGEEYFILAQQVKEKDQGKALKLCAQAYELTPNLAAKITNLRDEINSQNKPIKGAVIGTLGLSSHFIFVDDKLELGRKITDFKQSFSINYQRISRVGKQCEFLRQSNRYFVKDQGSSNGTVLNGVPLFTNKLARLTDGSTVLVGGVINQPHSLCQLDCKVIGDHSPALNITLSSHASALMNGFDTDKNIKHAWPSMDVDFLTHWTLMSGEINLGLNKQGNIDLGCVESGETLAKLIYDDGFYLAPVIDATTKDSSIIELLLNNQIVYSKMPLQKGFVASLNGCLFSFKANS